MKRLAGALGAAVLVAVAVTAVVAPARLGLASGRAKPAGAGAARAALASMPIRFEANQGQTDESVRFVARQGAASVYLTDSEAVFSLGRPSAGGEKEAGEASVVRMRAAGGRSVRPEATAASRLPGLSNYLIGNDPSKWRQRVPAYGRVTYPGVYPGIDLVYHGERGSLEYDFVVAPGAEPDLIGLDFEGHQGASIDDAGDLVLSTAAGPLRHKKPVTYQMVDGRSRPVDSRYRLGDQGRVGFRVGDYDPTRPLVIDPEVVVHSTYLGGALRDQGIAVAADAAGFTYVTGSTYSLDFPGAPRPAPTGDAHTDVFVAKLSPDLSGLVYATYFGGTRSVLTTGTADDHGWGIAVDPEGQAYISGETQCDDFPTTPGAYKPVLRGDTATSDGDGFVTKLNAAGTSLVYSTYLGAPIWNDQLLDIAVDGAGDAYVAGYSLGEFPTTPNAYQRAHPGGRSPSYNAVFAKLRPAGRGPLDLVYSTYLGGAGEDVGQGVAVDDAGRAWVSGNTMSADDPATPADEGFPTTPGAIKKPAGDVDAFLTVLDPAKAGVASLVYSTAYGGSDSEYGTSVDLLPSGEAAWITGRTASTDFPTTAGALRATAAPVDNFDGYVIMLRPGAPRLLYSTYFALPQNRKWFGAGDVAVDSAGDAWITGGNRLAKLRPGGAGSADRRFDLALGAEGTSVALDGAGGVYVTGLTGPGFAVSPGAFQPQYGGGERDAFVLKVVPPPPPPGEPPPPPPPPPPPSVSIADVTVTEGDDGTVEAKFPVFLSAAATKDVAVDFTTAPGSAGEGSDYLPGAGTVIFPAGSTSQVVIVAVRGDTLVEPDETYFVELARPLNASVGVGAALGTIVDDDDPAVTGEGPDATQDPAVGEPGEGQLPSPAQPQPGAQAQPQPGTQPQGQSAAQVQGQPVAQVQGQPAAQVQTQVQAQSQVQTQVQAQAQLGVMAQRERAPGLASETLAGRDTTSNPYLASAHRPVVPAPRGEVALFALAVVATTALCANRHRRRPAPVRARAHSRRNR